MSWLIFKFLSQNFYYSLILFNIIRLNYGLTKLDLVPNVIPSSLIDNELIGDPVVKLQKFLFF